MIHLDTYRITRDGWGRTWQCESPHVPINAERGWTQRGAERRFLRAVSRYVA